MGRLVAVFVLAAVVCAGVAYFTGMLSIPGDRTLITPTNSDGSTGPKTVFNLGDYLYKPGALKALPASGEGRAIDPTRISATLTVKEKQEVPSIIEGQIAFIGEEVPLGALLISGGGAFLGEPYNIIKIKVPNGEPGDVPDREVPRVYRRLMRGQIVQTDQMVALLNPARAQTDLIGKEAKMRAAEAEYLAAAKTTLVAKYAYELAVVLHGKGDTASRFEVITSELQWTKSQQEEAKLKEGVALAKSDITNAQLILGQHEIRSQVKNGIIKEIRKNLGEAVKPGETIMEVQDLDSYLAEGPIDGQYFSRLKVGMPVIIVPTQEESPDKVWRHHRKRVNSVGFTSHKNRPLVVSGSEDWTVQVWDRTMSHAKFGPFFHAAPVRVVACSPTDPDLILSGCSDGSIHSWSLQDGKDTPIPEKDKAHREAVTCLAFSPDGKWFASGCVDASIKLWNVETRDLVYTFDAEHGCVNGHQGPITSLHFTPQCRLVSASQDNSVRVWKLKQLGVELQGLPLTGRNGSVAQLGVSDDGRYMLFDLGNSLQILSVEDGKTLNTVQNPAGNVGFQTLALFSPDASLLLTGGAAEGRLQLWSAPHGNEFGYEVRQLVPDANERSTVACAAFAPRQKTEDGGQKTENGGRTLAASGTEEGSVYLWSIPSDTEVKNHPIRNVPLSFVNPAQNVTNRQIQIGAEVSNSTGRLIPGRPVTIIIEHK